MDIRQKLKDADADAVADADADADADAMHRLLRKHSEWPVYLVNLTNCTLPTTLQYPGAPTGNYFTVLRFDRYPMLLCGN